MPEIARVILKDLAKNGFLDLSNLSRTCHTGLDIVGKYVEVWDETPPGDFLGEDVSLDPNDEAQRTPVTIMVSPVRKAWSSRDGMRPDISYAEHYETEKKLCKFPYLRLLGAGLGLT
jgi:hypothetical protein